MKPLGLLFASLATLANLHAQKPPLNANVYGKWPALGSDGAISPDGRYVVYTLENQPVGGRTLVMQASSARWKLEIPGASGAELTADGRHAVFMKSQDSLGLVTLGRSAVTHFPQVKSFKLPKGGTGEWLAYEVTTPAPALVARQLRTGRQRSFAAVTDYVFSPDGAGLVLTTESGPDSARTHALQWVRLAEGTPPRTIWQGTRASALVFDAPGTQLAFLGEGPGSTPAGPAVWRYRAGTASAVRVADQTTPGLEPGLQVGGLKHFSRDGRRLFVSLQEAASPPTPKPDAVPVHVWSYTDATLQSQQVRELDPTSMAAYVARALKNYTAVLRLDDRRLIRLQQEDEYFSYDQNGTGSDAFGLTEPRHGGMGEENWNRGFQGPAHLVSTTDGTRKPVRTGATLSPGGKYLIDYDGAERQFFSYEVASGETRNLTRGLAVTWIGAHADDFSEAARGVAGWVQGDAAVLLYDRHDLWQVDPTGKKPPRNLTNGYGRRHDIVFTLVLAEDARRALAPKAKLLLSAFDLRTKDHGFYRTGLGRAGDPERLSMGPYLYDTRSPYAPHDADSAPLKARDAEVYLVRRMAASEAPNYFTTTDFKSYTPLTDLHPERAYTWYRAELHTWPMLDGRPTQGVLYKPENFDSTQRYPVIVHIYERKSDGLHAYLTPEALSGAGCTINIPSYVSRGYLVFTPDIYYTLGEPGPSAVNAVVAAADYLAQLPGVDAKKLGLQGCSWGGYETNYLVTHTNRFAAAVAASSLADFVSGYGSVGGMGNSLQGMYETGQQRMGVTLWQRPELYVKNSPIFRADQVSTPLLLMQTTTDGVTLFSQAVEFFTALRRLGKRAWLLQYDEGDHGLWGKPADDFSLRMAQFFDHYLKGAPAAKWMTRGIPATMKGIDDGLALDLEIPTPGPGLVADETRTSSDSARTHASP